MNKIIYMYTMKIIAFVILILSPTILNAQYHRKLFYPDIQYLERLSVFNNTVKDRQNEKVAWRKPSFLLPQFIVGLNVFNHISRFDYGIRIPIAKNNASTYKDISRKDTLVFDRFWQFSPGIYVKFKLGNYVEKYRYWVIYSDANYSFNFGLKQKEMKFRYKSFDIFNDEFNIYNGAINLFNRAPVVKKFNKTKDVLINKTAGPSLSIGLGRETSYYGKGWGYIITVTKNFYDLYDKNYTLPNNDRPFKEWHQGNVFIELKFIYKITFLDQMGMAAANAFNL